MSRSWYRPTLVLLSTVWLMGAGAAPAADRPGLLFYVSGERGLEADVSAGGTPRPNFSSGVRVIDGGARGKGLECGHAQLLSYWAPGNMYAQRATLSFFWRSREPVGPTPFPIVHILVPSDFRDTGTGGRNEATSSWKNFPGGLDGIVLELPALKVAPTHGGLFPLRIQVKDPIWPLRTLIDVSVSVKPGETRTIWLVGL